MMGDRCELPANSIFMLFDAVFILMATDGL